MNMAECGVAGYRQILESVESPTRWKEKTLQAGSLLHPLKHAASVLFLP